MNVRSHGYASSAMVRRAITAAASAGVQIGSVKLHVDGAIELIGIQHAQQTPSNDYDRLEAAGCL